ncbi:MAG: glutathione gamma-glutamylcysteinyltransferase [Legionella sp.]|nr:MAG: glutathione gamma-glutamylcysteinyltransferase [Legionella sp.]
MCVYLLINGRLALNRILISTFLIILTASAYAKESLAPHLVPFSSQSGLMLLKKDANVTTLKLLEHFVTQQTGTYCGIASAVMVLNATNTIPPEDPHHLSYTYFTQDAFFTAQVQSIITSEEVAQHGIDIIQLAQAIRTYGLKVTPYFSNDLTEETFKQILMSALSKQQFVIVNFLRTELLQKGRGHHSPLAAYDQQTDRFLVLDVARFKYGSYWVKSHDLWQAVHTVDDNRYRGFIVITAE